MEEAPTPDSFKGKKNNKKKDDSESFDFCCENSNGLFQIFITKYNDNIEIICMNILDEEDSNKKYSNKFNSKSLNEIMGERNINKAYQILKQIPPINILIEPNDNIIILSIKSSSIKKNFPLYKPIDINDCLTKINQLENQNNDLNNRLKEFENKFKIICEYNLFDLEVHKLEKIFEQLTTANNTPFKSHKPLINRRAELGVINKGIKHIFNKNIESMKMIYCSKKDGEAPDKFIKKYNESIDYSVIIIHTKDEDEKKFGIFCNKEENYAFDNINNIQNNFQFINNRLEDYLNNDNDYFQQNQPKMINFPMYQDNNYIDIFNSNSICNKYFLFSLDDFSIFYSNECDSFPNISIKFNNQFKCLFGNENYGNNNMNNPPMANNTNNLFNTNKSNFKLSGNNQFNIDEYELYSIELEKIE